MPKIPQVFASGEVGGAISPPRMSASGTDLSGLEALSKNVQNLAGDYLKNQQKVSDEQAKVDAELGLTEFERQAADADIALRQDQNVAPEDYARRVDENLRAAREGVSKTLPTAESRRLFERSSEPFIRKQGIEAKYEGLRRGESAVMSGTAILLRRDANFAGAAETQEEIDAHVARGLGRIEALRARNMLTGKEASAMNLDFMTQVEESQYLRMATKPELRGGLIENLMKGGASYMAPTHQVQLAERLMKQQEDYQNRLDKQTEKAAEEQRKAVTDRYYALADAGKLSAAELDQANRDRVVIGDDYRKLLKEVREAGQAGGRTDDDLYNQMELDILQNPRRNQTDVSQAKADIRAMAEAGKLAKAGPRSAATLMRMIDVEAKEAEAKDITQKPLFKEGLKDIEHGPLRGGVGALESLTKEAAARMNGAIREYHDIARSGKFTEDQLPEVARKIVERRLQQTPLTIGDPEKFLLLRYQTPSDLMAAKKAGVIPDAEFNRQFKLMGDLGLLKPKEDIPAIKKQATQGGKPGAGR
jgi:hypothetical protein